LQSKSVSFGQIFLYVIYVVGVVVAVVVVALVVVLAVVVSVDGGTGGQPAHSVNVSAQINKLKKLTLIVLSEWRLKWRFTRTFMGVFVLF
jgi:hypothetical protein